MEMQSFQFAQLASGLALVQYFLSMVPFLHFGMVMYILCHDVGEECDLSAFNLDFKGVYSLGIVWVSEETQNFEVYNVLRLL